MGAAKPQLDRLRDDLLLRGVRVSDDRDAQLAAVIAHVGGDVDLAADALKMRPRPAWLRKMLQ